MITALGWALTVIGVVAALPQLSHLLKGRTDGVSLWTWTSGACVYMIWSSFSLHAQLWPALTFDVVNLSTQLVAVWLLRRHLHVVHLVAVVVAGLVAAGAYAWAPVALGVIGTVGSTLRAWPQVHAALAHPDPRGVSKATWTLEGITAAGWLVYGIGMHQPVLGAYALGMVPACALIVWRLRRVRSLDVTA